MRIREPLTIQRLRKSAVQSPEVTVLLWHIDALVERLERFENLGLPESQLLAVAGPATGTLDSEDLWELRRDDLMRLARRILEAAMKEHAGRV